MKRGNLLRWPDLIHLAVGVWLGFSPWLLGFFDELPIATWNALVSGVAVIVLATVDLDSPAAREQWLLALVGGWLVLSPVLLDYTQDRLATAAAIATGTGVLALAACALLAARRARTRQGRR